MARFLLMMTLSLVLAGCAAFDMRRPIANDDLGRLKKVGVVSLLGDTVYGVEVGTTVFGNSEFDAQVPDWNVDATSTAQALAVLKSNGHFAVEPLDRGSYSTAQLAADRAKLVWDLAQRQGLDAVVILWPSVSDNYRFFRPGYGIYEHSFLGMAHRCLYAAYIVEVDSVATRKRLAWQWGSGDMDTPCRMGSEDRLRFKSSFSAYSEFERQAMRDGIQARISETLPKTLAKLDLVGN